MERRSADQATPDTELDSLLRALSHDLKAPLANIRGFVELLEEGGLSKEQERHFLARVRCNTDVMGRLISDLAELAGIGLRPEPLEDIAAGEVAREVLQLEERSLSERQAEVLLATDLPRVRYPRHRLLQIFTNIIEHALDHRSGELKLRIGIACRTAAGEHRFQVTDNGTGIDREEQRRLFEPFASRQKKTARVSGLGLAIARRIVEKNGGRIWVESDPGEGASYFFTIPV